MTEPEDIQRITDRDCGLLEVREWERRAKLMRRASRAMWASFAGTVAVGAILVWLWLR